MSASGKSPPNPPGWVKIWVDDFDTDVPMGKVIGHPAYEHLSARKTGTPTSGPWKTGIYDNGRLEVKGSCLITHVATITDSRGTKPRTSALLPELPPMTAYPWGVEYGRFSVRFRIPQELPGYKIAWLLWPDSKLWPKDGEIDFPEQNLHNGDRVKGFMHRQDATQGSDQVRALGPGSCCDNVWHTATITWRSGLEDFPVCKFTWDGVDIGRYTTRVPNGPMHWVLQTEPYLSTWDPPDPKVAGRIEVDWIVAYKKA